MTTLTGSTKTSQKKTKTATPTNARTKARSFAVARKGVQAGIPVVVWALVIRTTTLIFDYMLVMATAIGLIPMIGLYLHQASGAAQNELTTSGTVALWILPFLFVVTVLTVAEIVLMRSLWRAGGRRIAKLRARHAAR